MRALLWCLLASVLLAGCGDKDGDGAGFDRPPQEDGAYIITITSTGIDPSKAEVPVDAIVEWRVAGQGCHIVADDGAFDSKRSQGSGTTYNNGIVPAGSSYRWFTTEGSHDYGCSGRDVHGTLRVG